MNILLVDNHRIVRDGLRALLEKEKDMTVVGEAEDGRKAVSLVAKMRPDAVILDIVMPEMNGIDAVPQMLREHPSLKVVALSLYTDPHFVKAMLAAGASAYVSKDDAFDDISAALRAVVVGQTYLSASVSPAVADDYRRYIRGERPDEEEILSPREREVLQLLAEGQSVQDIANALHVSPKTVETHRANIKKKLGVHSLPELTKYAIREGLTSPNF